MGLSHLIKIESILKDGKHYTKSELRDISRMNFNTLTDVISYLLTTKKIKETTVEGKIGYKWQSANTSKNVQKNMQSKKCSVEKHTTSTSKLQKKQFMK